MLALWLSYRLMTGQGGQHEGCELGEAGMGGHGGLYAPFADHRYVSIASGTL